jgi:glutaredoxin 3
MKVIVWSKENCSQCEQSKALLKSKSVDYEERKIGDGWTRDDLLAVAPSARSVPQIFFGDVCVGGFKELQERLL